MHDGSLRRIAVGFAVLSDELLSCREINIKVRNDGDHNGETIGIYMDVIPPGGPSDLYGCLPNGRFLETAIAMDSAKNTTIHSVTGNLNGTEEKLGATEVGYVAFSCSDQAGAVGLTYTIITVVDAHGDDLASCPPGALLTIGCFSALADDDSDTGDNRRSRSAPKVKGS